MWLRTDAGWLVWNGDSVRPVDGLDAELEAIGVDGSGRLWINTDGVIERVGAEYTVQVKGVTPDQALDVEVWAQVVPSFADDVGEIAVWLNGEAVPYTADGISLEPTELGDGAHE